MKYLLIFLCALTASAQPPTAKATFFSEDQSMMKQMGQFKIDYAAAGSHWNIYMDGIRLVTLHRGRMVTFLIPSGHHDFKTDRTVMLPVDVAPGESVFIRPGMRRTDNKLEGIPEIKVVVCADYLEKAKKIKPVNATDVFTGAMSHEASFSGVLIS